METQVEKFGIYGLSFSCLDLNEGYNRIVNYDFSKPSYICFPSTNLIADAHFNKQLRDVYNNAYITFADGKFTEYYARSKGVLNLKNVSGLDLLDLLLDTDLTHYFYGLSESELLILKTMIINNHANARVLGYNSPPILDANNIPFHEKLVNDINVINMLKPDLIWIGLGYPKQEIFMDCYVGKIEHGLMLGVGAVLLYKAGIIKTGPRWIKSIGMRWLFRLIQEPKRLWKRMIPSMLTVIYLYIKYDLLGNDTEVSK